MYINSLNSFEDMLCLSLIGRGEKKSKLITTLSFARKPTFGDQWPWQTRAGSRRDKRTARRHPRWAWPIQVALWNTIFFAETKAGLLITPGTKGREAGARCGEEPEGVWEHLCQPPFFFFSLRLGTHMFWGGSICSWVYWRPRVPADTTGTVRNPYKPERSCESTVCEVVGERGKGEEGLKRKISGPLWLSSAGQSFLKGQLSSSGLHSSEQQTAAECAASSRHSGKSKS